MPKNKMRGPGDGPGGFSRNQRGNRPNDDMDEERLGGGKGHNDFFTGRNNRFGPRDLFRLMGQYQMLQGMFGGFGSEEGSGNEGTIYEDDVNYYGTPGQGQYVGDYTNSPYSQPGLTNQMGASGSIGGGEGGMADPFQNFWPQEQAPVPGVGAGPGVTDLALAAGAGAAPAASPASFKGAPQDQVAMAMKFGQQYGVDPGVLLAIAKHETGYGTLGLGRKGLTLGYGAFDNNPSFKWQGPENQYQGAARTLASRGVHNINELVNWKGNMQNVYGATDPGWPKAVAAAYSSLAPQLAGGAPAAPTSATPSSPPPPLEPEKSEEDDDEDDED